MGPWLQLGHSSSLGIHFIKSYLNQCKRGSNDCSSNVGLDSSIFSGTNCLTQSRIVLSLYCSDILLYSLKELTYEEGRSRLLRNIIIFTANIESSLKLTVSLCQSGMPRVCFSNGDLGKVGRQRDHLIRYYIRCFWIIVSIVQIERRGAALSIIFTRLYIDCV